MKKATYILFFSIIFWGCSPQKDIEPVKTHNIYLDTFSVSPNYEPVYQAAETHYFDLLHTKLNVRFDWQKQHLLGQAHLTLTPWFYDTDKLMLDAKGFDLHVVAIENKDGVKELKHSYDSLEILVQLDKVYTKKDTFTVYIEYTAKPNKLEEGGSSAITSDKGLYFIDPLNEDPEKPSQIWTQGETEASSCWFPTIDIPNEKMTQEIAITVENKYMTLSNGELTLQMENEDGTRTDYWEMNKSHAPYLAMMAIGEFSIVEDSWRDSIAVHYYVEPKYEPYAQQIFGNTPEMMECFSKTLGVDYPWNKYHQIVVRDYVSGAMENTTAVIHGEFVQQTAREMIDQNEEDIVSHELFHHWFGDLVTCESWSNLPLNESFATYGEYIWREWKYGRESADYHLQGMLSDYIYESQSYQEDMIRYYFDDKEEMFDGHSYSKGGRILHMLRKTIGDDAFYQSLQLYLTENAYKTTEIHDLRKAFEQVTGQDLNWFFNQWFLSSGHPDLLITYDYDDSLKLQNVIIEQKQLRKETPVYTLPMVVDLYFEDTVFRKNIVVTERQNVFSFDAKTLPLLVNVDAEKMLLCEKNDVKPINQWIYQYHNAPLYLDRYEAVYFLGREARKNTEAAKVILSALDDSFWKIRSLAMDQLDGIFSLYENEIKTKLIHIAHEDEKSIVRAQAISTLSAEYGKDESLKELFVSGTKDSSYAILRESLIALTNLDQALGLKVCKQFEKELNNEIIESLCFIYSSYGDDSHNNYFLWASQNIKGYGRLSFLNDYEFYLSGNRNYNIVNEGVVVIKKIGIEGHNRYVSIFAKQALDGLLSEYKGKQHEINKKMSSSNQLSEIERQNLQNEEEQIKGLISTIADAYIEVEKTLK